jgi:hypothetical protein
MELYNAIKSDLTSLWNSIGIPVVIVYGVIGAIALLIIITAFVKILGAHRRMNRRMNRFW